MPTIEHTTVRRQPRDGATAEQLDSPDRQAGARRDFALALTQTRDHLFRFALRLARERSAADDLVQSTLERALRSSAGFREDCDLLAWTKSILRNRFIDDYRRARMVAGERESPRYEPGDLDLGPIDVLSMEDVNREVQTLEAVNRTLFELAYLQRRSHREIAARTGMRIETVATRLFRIRRELRRRLLHTCSQRGAKLAIQDVQ